MKKILLSIGLLGLSLALLIPYWTGIEAQKQFAQFNQNLPSQANLKLLANDYKRNWFSSQVQSVFETPGTSRLLPIKRRFMVSHSINHGWLPIQATTIQSSVYDVESKNQELPQSQGNELLKANTVIKINGDAVTTLSIPPLTLNDEKNHAQLYWQGLVGQVQFESAGLGINGSLHSPQVKLNTEQGQIDIQNVQVEVRIIPQGLTKVANSENSEGQAIMRVAKIHLVPQHRPPLLLEQITLKGHHHRVNEYLTAGLETSVQQVQIGEERYGPGQGNLTLRHLHLESLISIINTIYDEGAEGQSAKPLNMMMMGTLIQQGLTFLKNQPELEIDSLKIDSPEGKLEGTAQIKMTEFDASGYMFLNPMSFLNDLSARIKMRLPISTWQQLVAAWLDLPATADQVTVPSQVQQRLQTWLEQGILVNDDNQYYSLLLQWQQGELQSHGKTLPPDLLWSLWQ